MDQGDLSLNKPPWYIHSNIGLSNNDPETLTQDEPEKYYQTYVEWIQSQGLFCRLYKRQNVCVTHGVQYDDSNKGDYGD